MMFVHNKKAKKKPTEIIAGNLSMA